MVIAGYICIWTNIAGFRPGGAAPDRVRNVDVVVCSDSPQAWLECAAHSGPLLQSGLVAGFHVSGSARADDPCQRAAYTVAPGNPRNGRALGYLSRPSDQRNMDNWARRRKKSQVDENWVFSGPSWPKGN
jgi:hypothetical protein